VAGSFSAPGGQARREIGMRAEPGLLAPTRPVGSSAASLLLAFAACAVTAATLLSVTNSRTLFGLDEGIYLGKLGTVAHFVL
jgi:hypothetical protein